MESTYTVLIRKSRLEYVAVCLELNIAARGVDLVKVEKNLRAAIELFLEDKKERPETEAAPIPIEELIEFLKDTEPEWYRGPELGCLLRPLEVHEGACLCPLNTIPVQ